MSAGTGYVAFDTRNRSSEAGKLVALVEAVSTAAAVDNYTLALSKAALTVAAGMVSSVSDKNTHLRPNQR